MKTMSDITKVPKINIPYSKFDLSHNRKLSCKIGELVPVMCQECMPGDVWKINTEVFARLAPLVSPMMHKVDIFIHGFFVPMRLLYNAHMPFHTAVNNETWERFISGAIDDSYMVPAIELNAMTITAGSLSDHLGIPVGDWTNLDATEYINVMPHMAYMMIWNEYYRDQHLQTEYILNDDGDISDLLEIPLKLRAWEKDYFTSAWPYAQMGVASAAVIQQDLTVYSEVFNTSTGAALTGTLSATSGVLKQGTTTATLAPGELSLDIAELRRANTFQIWMERTARSGSRYIEFLNAHFGVAPLDARLQRPEYIGGGVQNFVVSDVTNTTGFTDAETNALPMGTLAGKGTSYGRSNMMYKKCEEHGYIMIIMSIRPEAVYYQGLPKMFKRLTYLDFPYPEFANMGEMEVKNYEIYLKNINDGTNHGLFGYQSQYADLKYIPNSLHGTFRTTMDFWTMARKFTDTPDLNDTFITIKEDTDDLQRVFAVADIEHVYAQVSHRIEADRPLPFFNIPSLE